MPLLAYNLTGAPVTLAAGSPPPVLPASSAPPNRSPAVNVTSELGGLSGAAWAAIQAQIDAGSVQLEWSGTPEYSDGLTWRSYDAASQLTWYVDSVTGSDLNDGATSSTALATISEFFRRMDGHSSSAAITVNLSGDFGSETVVATGRFGFNVLIQGERQIIVSGTLTGVTAYNHTPGAVAVGTITDAGMAGTWTPLVGEKIVITTPGPNEGAWAWVLRDDGGKTATISPWWHPGWYEITPLPGETYEVVKCTFIYRVVVGDVGSSVSFYDVCLLGDVPGFIASAMINGNVVFHGCKLDGAYVGLIASYTMLVCCYIVNGTLAERSEVISYQSVWGGSALQYWDNTTEGLFFSANVAFGNYAFAPAISIGGAMRVSWGALGVITTGAVTAMRVAPGGLLTLDFSTMWCSGAGSGTGIEVKARGGVVWDFGHANTRFDFTGTTNDFVIGGTNVSIAALGVVGYSDTTKIASVTPA